MASTRPVLWFFRLLPAVIALSLASGAKVAQEPASLGECLAVQTPWPVRLPDDSVHPAATIQICNSREYSPVQFLEKVSVNGFPVGMFLSRTGFGEAPVKSAPFVAFSRGPGGVYRLDACGWPEPNRTRIFFLRQDRSPTRWTQGAGVESRSSGGGPPVLLAAVVERP